MNLFLPSTGVYVQTHAHACMHRTPAFLSFFLPSSSDVLLLRRKDKKKRSETFRRVYTSVIFLLLSLCSFFHGFISRRFSLASFLSSKKSHNKEFHSRGEKESLLSFPSLVLFHLHSLSSVVLSNREERKERRKDSSTPREPCQVYVQMNTHRPVHTLDTSALSNSFCFLRLSLSLFSLPSQRSRPKHRGIFLYHLFYNVSSRREAEKCIYLPFRFRTRSSVDRIFSPLLHLFIHSFDSLFSPWSRAVSSSSIAPAAVHTRERRREDEESRKEQKKERREKEDTLACAGHPPPSLPLIFSSFL